MITSSPPCLLLPSSTNAARNVVLDTSPIQCTSFYYDQSGTGHEPPATKTDGAGSLGPPPPSPSSNLSMHLLQQDKTRRKRLKRSNTTSIFSLLGSSNSNSNRDDQVEPKDHKKRQHRPPVVTRKTTQGLAHYRPVRLIGRDNMTWTCLDNRTAEHLCLFLPSRVTVAIEWHLLYSMDQHGTSLQTLYNKVREYSGPCLLVIQTTYEEIFGGYLSESLHVQTRNYGSGECFLWKLQKNDQSGHARPAVYRWTGKNDYLIYSSREYLALGGGNGRVGLWLDQDLLHGHTETCATFDNEPLTSEKKFECLALEIWGFRF